jgi:hypothetical protein
MIWDLERLPRIHRMRIGCAIRCKTSSKKPDHLENIPLKLFLLGHAIFICVLKRPDLCFLLGAGWLVNSIAAFGRARRWSIAGQHSFYGVCRGTQRAA